MPGGGPGEDPAAPCGGLDQGRLCPGRGVVGGKEEGTLTSLSHGLGEPPPPVEEGPPSCVMGAGPSERR